MSDVEFAKFIRSMLKMAELGKQSIERCTDKDSLQRFRTAFTHKSLDIDAVSNYELAELKGDGIINSIIIRYITEVRFPGVVNVDWITRLKTNFISKKGLSRIASSLGFGEFIEYSEEYGKHFEQKNKEELWNMNRYISLYEDTFEAFAGMLVEVIDTKLSPIDPKRNIHLPGPGYGIASLLIYNILDQIPIELKYDVVWDPFSRVKEIFDKRKKSKGWPDISKSIKETDFWQYNSKKGKNERIFELQLYAYVLGDKTANLDNRIVVATAKSVNRDKAKMELARQALVILAQYNIRDMPKDSYKRKN